ncbi:MAG: DNA translocase FtsK 4TM domain-containing protein, partial [Clostridia bacterium]|nr:DNA translocase FtsK 4TM domain-containing protein [Clostridia bacterium]
MRKDNKIRGAYASLTGFRRAVPIILFALALFTGLCFVAPGSVGLGKYVADFFKGLFSVGGFFIPFLLMIHALFYPQDTLKKRTVSRLVFSVTVLLFFSAFLHAIKSFSTDMTFSPADFYNAGKELSGGGFFGGILGFVLMKVFGPVGLIIIAALIFALYITYFFANGKSTLAKILLVVLDKISAFFNNFSKKRKEEKAERREKAEAKRIDAKAPRLSEKHSDLYEDDFFSVNNGLSELKIEELGINEKRNPKDMELFPKLQDKVLHEADNVTSMKDSDTYLEEKEEPTVITFEDKTEPKKEAPAFDGDEFTESADSIFAKEFDPFDFTSNANLAKRQMSNTKEAHESLNEYAEPVKVFFSEDKINEARRADFEARKKALLEAEARRREIEEEAEKQRKLRELLSEEPKPEKATYTSSSGTLYENEDVGEKYTEAQNEYVYESSFDEKE